MAAVYTYGAVPFPDCPTAFLRGETSIFDLRGVPDVVSVVLSDPAELLLARWEQRRLILPPNLAVGGNLDLSYSGIRERPPGLRVGGDLDLRHTRITTLPADLQVGGNLIASSTTLKILPEDLRISGVLDLYNTELEALPYRFAVGGIDIWRTPAAQYNAANPNFVWLEQEQLTLDYEEPKPYQFRCKIGNCRLYHCSENHSILLSDRVGFDIFPGVRPDILEAILSGMIYRPLVPALLPMETQINFQEALVLFYLVTGQRLERTLGIFLKNRPALTSNGKFPLSHFVQAVAEEPGGDKLAEFFVVD